MKKIIQYAEIPIECFEVINSSKLSLNNESIRSKLRYKLSKLNPYNKFKMRSIIVKIKLDKNPYIEELLTKNKIGLNKKDGYKVYLKNDIIYTICNKETAYLKIAEQLNYREEINNIFS